MGNTKKHLLMIVKAWLIRLQADGVMILPKDDFRKLFKKGVDLKDPEIQEEVRKWEKEGLIRFIGEEDRYIELIRHKFEE